MIDHADARAQSHEGQACWSAKVDRVHYANQHDQSKVEDAVEEALLNLGWGEGLQECEAFEDLAAKHTRRGQNMDNQLSM